MKTFFVLAVCVIGACVAAPNGYGIVRQSQSYAAPTPIRVLTSTAAPLVLRNAYATYEQPAEIKKTYSPIVSYSLDNDNKGTFSVATVTADQSTFNQEGTLKNVPGEEKPVSVMKGSYSFVEEGKTYTVNWVADENGYRAEGAHLPVSPQIQQALMMMGPGSD